MAVVPSTGYLSNAATLVRTPLFRDRALAALMNKANLVATAFLITPPVGPDQITEAMFAKSVIRQTPSRIDVAAWKMATDDVIYKDDAPTEAMILTAMTKHWPVLTTILGA